MSTIDEDTVLVPWVGPLSSKNTITVIVVSTNADIINSIANSLTEVHKKGNHRWKLVVLRSYALDAVVRESDLTGRLAIDFVVLAMETTRMYCLEWGKSVLAQIHPDLRRRRVILVNTGGLPDEMAVSPGELISFQKEHNLDLITAERLNLEGGVFLARRLLRYLEASIGLFTGIPNLNV